MRREAFRADSQWQDLGVGGGGKRSQADAYRNNHLHDFGPDCLSRLPVAHIRKHESDGIKEQAAVTRQSDYININVVGG